MYHHKLLWPISHDFSFEFHLHMTYYKQTMNSKVPMYNQLNNCMENELLIDLRIYRMNLKMFLLYAMNIFILILMWMHVYLDYGKFKPGHSWELQASVSVSAPEHVPPKASVTNFIRSFVRAPPPHGLLQADHEFQGAQLQLTRWLRQWWIR